MSAVELMYVLSQRSRSRSRSTQQQPRRENSQNRNGPSPPRTPIRNGPSPPRTPVRAGLGYGRTFGFAPPRPRNRSRSRTTQQQQPSQENQNTSRSNTPQNVTSRSNTAENVLSPQNTPETIRSPPNSPQNIRSRPNTPRNESTSTLDYQPTTKTCSFNQCPICLNSIYKFVSGVGISILNLDIEEQESEQPDGSKLAITSCGHSFHYKCIKKWQDNAKDQGRIAKCPFCRSLLRDEVRPVCVDLEIVLPAARQD